MTEPLCVECGAPDDHPFHRDPNYVQAHQFLAAAPVSEAAPTPDTASTWHIRVTASADCKVCYGAGLMAGLGNRIMVCGCARVDSEKLLPAADAPPENTNAPSEEMERRERRSSASESSLGPVAHATTGDMECARRNEDTQSASPAQRPVPTTPLAPAGEPTASIPKEIRRAGEEIERLSHGRGRMTPKGVAGRSWTMSVPVRPDDSDMILVDLVEFAAMADVERAELRARVASLTTEREQMRRVGAQMANLCFNLAQASGSTLSERNCEIMNDLRKQWDAAIHPSPESPV